MRVKRTLTVVAAIAASVSLTACEGSVSVGEKTVNVKNAEKLMSAEISKQVGETVTVTCPSKVKAKTGAKFECEATSEAGDKRAVAVTQKDNDGNISFELK